MLTDDEIRMQLKSALVKCGIPDWAIDEESNLSFSPNGDKEHLVRPDLIVLAATEEIPLAIFEIKVAKGNDEGRDFKAAYRESRANVALALRNDIKCFVVMSDANDNLQISRIYLCRWCRPRWRELSDSKQVTRLLGDYYAMSQYAKYKSEKLGRFRWWVCFTGFIVAFTAALSECLGMEYSLKVYSLVGFLFALYAVSYGIAVSFKFKGYEMSLVPKDHKNNSQQAEA